MPAFPSTTSSRGLPSTKTWSLLFAWGCVALPWVVAWLTFAGLGGWPSNDDPFYAKPLALWAQDGSWQWVRQNGELTASSVAHVITGRLMTTAGNFAYRDLFLLCILQQSLGAAALFAIARALDLSLGLAWLSAFTLSTFPLFFGHAFTFMTDGPASAWSALACAFAALGVVRGDWRWLGAASAAIGWGYWIRQTNALLIMAPLLALSLLAFQLRVQARDLAQSRVAKARAGIKEFSALLLVAGAAVCFLESGWLFTSSVHRARDVAPSIAEGYAHRMMVAAYGWLLLCGWYALPWLVLLIQAAREARRTMPRWADRLCLIGAGACLLGSMTPLVTSAGRACLTNATGAFIQNAHFGPIFLSDMDEPGRWGTLDGVEWPLWSWQVLSVLALLSASSLAWWGVCTLVGWLRECRAGVVDPRSASAAGFLIMIIASVLAIVAFIEPHMDRYWLFLFPALTVWWLHLAAQHRWQLTRVALAWALLCMAIGLGLSMVFTHDMLAWNDVRWRYVNAQLASGVAAESIDAGRDVNAWLRMDEEPDTLPRAGDGSRWWSGRSIIALSVGHRPGWHAVDRLPWKSWATGRNHHLSVLQRELVPSIPADSSNTLEAQP